MLHFTGHVMAGELLLPFLHGGSRGLFACLELVGVGGESTFT